MLITDKIAKMIEEMLEQQNGTAEIRRNDFANRVGCVPSQINYVISSRFSNDHGYIVESRRGGGGYIKITRVRMEKSEYIMHMFATVGNALDTSTLRAYLISLTENGIIGEKEAKIYAALLSDTALGAETDRILRCVIRADMFKTLLLNLI
jgi:transcriptional regulator CtsR